MFEKGQLVKFTCPSHEKTGQIIKVIDKITKRKPGKGEVNYYELEGINGYWRSVFVEQPDFKETFNKIGSEKNV